MISYGRVSKGIYQLPLLNEETPSEYQNNNQLLLTIHFNPTLTKINSRLPMLKKRKTQTKRYACLHPKQQVLTFWQRSKKKGEKIQYRPSEGYKIAKKSRALKTLSFFFFFLTNCTWHAIESSALLNLGQNIHNQALINTMIQGL